MVISAITGNTVPITATTTSIIDSTVVRQIEDRKTNKDVENIMSTESYVREYFKDIPIMIQIARCESTFKQLNNDGEAIRNHKSSATGVMQIMASIHEDDAAELGMDINTLEGNIRFAEYLYNKYGTRPWNSSKPCWGKYLHSEGNKELALNNK